MHGALWKVAAALITGILHLQDCALGRLVHDHDTGYNGQDVIGAPQGGRTIVVKGTHWFIFHVNDFEVMSSTEESCFPWQSQHALTVF